MKKFLIICLSIVMILSTLLFCGFASPKSVSAAQEEQWEIVEVDGVEYYKKPVPTEGYVENIYFDISSLDSFGDFIYDFLGQTTYSYSYFDYNDNGNYRISQISGSLSDNIYTITIGKYYGVNILKLEYDITLQKATLLTNNLTNGYYVFDANYRVGSNVGTRNNELVDYIYILEEVPQVPTFVGSLINGMGQVFTEYVPLLAIGILSMFSGLFWQDGAFTILGYAFVVLAGIALVGSIFYIVYRIFKGKMRKRL